jgi:hypothetical protein
MQSIDQVQAAWAALDRQAQLEAWDAFTRSIDYGDQGFDPFYLVLWPMWEMGSSPFEDEDREYALAEIEADLARNEYFDAQIEAMDPCENAFWDRFTPEAADALLGCPF